VLGDEPHYAPQGFTSEMGSSSGMGSVPLYRIRDNRAPLSYLFFINVEESKKKEL
jgi:hypothetical protein